NIGLRRQVSQLNYFTEGNTPEALIGVPEQWTPDQIRQFQEYWDALLEGNLAARRHTRFVPGGLKYQPIRDVPLKDEFDEWLARVVCFAFSIPPTAFSKQTNRATAETAQGTATAEGLQPLLVWLKGLIDRVIGQVLGCADLEFAWTDRTAPDPATQATIAAGYVGAGIKTRNEVRAELGLDPVAGGDALTTATPAAPLPGGMVKANFNPFEPRGAHERWIRGGTGPKARLFLVDGDSAEELDRDAEPPGARRVRTFDEFPPYLQASVLAAGSTARVERLMEGEDLAETHYEYVQAQATLRQIDPNNRLLSGLHSPEWLPSEDDVAEMQAALRSATASAATRPNWRESESDVGRDLGSDARPQVSFKNGIEVRWGTPGSVRPDYVQADVATFEVKNYDIETNSAALIRNVADQAIQRAYQLPEQLIQNVIIDIRGQTVSESRQQDIIGRIVKRTNGALDADSIEFKRK
ncbi:MAG TPA: phage portal protein, partial [Aliidongia sp.]|uniref:phage portal protein n=1 Tax=Aliidongia sp. TaxID=1914230 RepID=UPI002DDCE412